MGEFKSTTRRLPTRLKKSPPQTDPYQLRVKESDVKNAITEMRSRPDAMNVRLEGAQHGCDDLEDQVTQRKKDEWKRKNPATSE